MAIDLTSLLPPPRLHNPQKICETLQAINLSILTLGTQFYTQWPTVLPPLLTLATNKTVEQEYRIHALQTVENAIKKAQKYLRNAIEPTIGKTKSFTSLAEQVGLTIRAIWKTLELLLSQGTHSRIPSASPVKKFRNLDTEALEAAIVSCARTLLDNSYLIPPEAISLDIRLKDYCYSLAVRNSGINASAAMGFYYLGILSKYETFQTSDCLADIIDKSIQGCFSRNIDVRIRASWTLANCFDVVSDQPELINISRIHKAYLAAITLASDDDKVTPSAARLLKQCYPSLHRSEVYEVSELETMTIIQTLLSASSPKTRWNACHACEYILPHLEYDDTIKTIRLSLCSLVGAQEKMWKVRWRALAALKVCINDQVLQVLGIEMQDLLRRDSKESRELAASFHEVIQQNIRPV